MDFAYFRSELIKAKYFAVYNDLIIVNDTYYYVNDRYFSSMFVSSKNRLKCHKYAKENFFAINGKFNSFNITTNNPKMKLRKLSLLF